MNNTTPLTDQEIRDTIRQMLADWDAQTPEVRHHALETAAAAAQAIAFRPFDLGECRRCLGDGYVEAGDVDGIASIKSCDCQDAR